MPRRRRLSSVATGCALLAASLSAQSPLQPAAVPNTSRSPVALNVYDRLRTNASDWYADPQYTTTYPYVEQLLRVSIAKRVQHFDWLAEFSSSQVFDVPAAAVSPVAARGNLGLGGNYYSANLSNTLPSALSFRQGFLRYRSAEPSTALRLGRFEFMEGAETTPRNPTILWLQSSRIAQRLIGNFGFSNGQRSFDGIDAHIVKNNWDITAMAGRPTQGVFNMNANPELNVDLQYLAYTRHDLKDHLLWRTFAVGFHDGRTGVVKSDNRPLAVRQADHKNIRIGTYGVDAVATIPAGNGSFDTLFWGVLQNGRWGLLTQRSGAFAAEVGYRHAHKGIQPWLRGGLFRSTGDGNNADAVHNTFFQLLPTSRIYARFPFYNLQNSTDWFAQIIDNPSRKLEVRADLHFLRLTSSSDLWYQGGGAFDTRTFGYAGRPSGGHRSLASVADISADYQVSGNLALNLYYAHSYGRSVVVSDYPAGHAANFGYLELVYKWAVKQRSSATK